MNVTPVPYRARRAEQQALMLVTISHPLKQRQVEDGHANLSSSINYPPSPIRGRKVEIIVSYWPCILQEFVLRKNKSESSMKVS